MTIPITKVEEIEKLVRERNRLLRFGSLVMDAEHLDVSVPTESAFNGSMVFIQNLDRQKSIKTLAQLDCYEQVVKISEKLTALGVDVLR